MPKIYTDIQIISWILKSKTSFILLSSSEDL